jgi:glycosyltransferase involved in cell wall biosynthesis
MPERRERHFAGKVLAFNAGYERVKELAFDVVGSLDADISFDPDYFAFLLEKLSMEPRLGLVGTRFKDSENFSYDYRFSSIEYVTGCCQLFRRACFEEIGGYVPAKGGAIDRIANIAARMKSWGTKTFLEKCYLHHRKFGTAEAGALTAKIKDGAKDYAVGTHPVWMFFRVIYQSSNKPYVIGAMALAWGYILPYLKRKERPVSRELIQFNRRDQMGRLKRILSGQTLRTHYSS